MMQRTGRLKIGLVAFSPSGTEGTVKRNLSQILETVGFSGIERVLVGKRCSFAVKKFLGVQGEHKRLNRHQVMGLLRDAKGKTVVLGSSIFLEMADEFRCNTGNEDSFLRNGSLIRWLCDHVNFPANLVFVHQLCLVPETFRPSQIMPCQVGYYVGRVLVSEAFFIAHKYEGQTVLLKNRIGEVGLLP